jgi:hypothetical protein
MALRPACATQDDPLFASTVVTRPQDEPNTKLQGDADVNLAHPNHDRRRLAQQPRGAIAILSADDLAESAREIHNKALSPRTLPAPQPGHGEIPSDLSGMSLSSTSGFEVAFNRLDHTAARCGSRSETMTDRRSFLIGALGTTLVAALKPRTPPSRRSMFSSCRIHGACGWRR